VAVASDTAWHPPGMPGTGDRPDAVRRRRQAAVPRPPSPLAGPTRGQAATAPPRPRVAIPRPPPPCRHGLPPPRDRRRPGRGRTTGRGAAGAARRSPRWHPEIRRICWHRNIFIVH